MTLGENCVRNEPWRNWEKRFEDWIEELKLSIVDGDMEKVKLTFSYAFLVLQSSFTYAASDKTKKGNKIMLRMKNKVINIALINFIAPEYISNNTFAYNFISLPSRFPRPDHHEPLKYLFGAVDSV